MNYSNHDSRLRPSPQSVARLGRKVATPKTTNPAATERRKTRKRSAQ